MECYLSLSVEKMVVPSVLLLNARSITAPGELDDLSLSCSALKINNSEDNEK